MVTRGKEPSPIKYYFRSPFVSYWDYNVHMCVCTSVCTRVCVCDCVYVYACVYVNMSMFVCMHQLVCVCVCARARLRVCVYVRDWERENVSVCSCLFKLVFHGPFFLLNIFFNKSCYPITLITISSTSFTLGLNFDHRNEGKFRESDIQRVWNVLHQM